LVVLGLIDSKPSAAAVLVDGRIVSAIAEERLCRMKLASGMPRQAISRVLAEAGVAARDLDQVAVAQNVSVFEPEPIPWSSWFENQKPLKSHNFDRLSSALAPLVGQFPLAWRGHHSLKRFVYRERLTRLPALLRQAYEVTAPVRFYDHHYCHAASAYYTSGFEQALVVTLDGGGDGRSGSVYLGQGGRLQLLAGVDSFNSLGNLYAYITHLCGFKAENHEGKVTGLAALGQPVYAGLLRQFIRYQAPGQIRYTSPIYHRSALQAIADRLPAGFDRADLAASVQQVLEEVGLAFVQYWMRRTRQRHLAVAGGVFANVKFNQRVHELEAVEHFFVHPAMDDSGLSVGSALAALAAQPGADQTQLLQRLPHVYLGPAYGDREVEQALSRAQLPAEYDPNIQATIAHLLAQGHVVARVTGPMEYGPRALGHRTILYQTSDRSVNDWLNERLDRTEFMPFAPATLVEHAHRCYEGLSGAEDPARFMTLTFNCSATMRAESPGVVHVDGTARPQLVDAQTAPDFHQILLAYHRQTGIPSLINTSFNMHGEPIVCTPEDALRSFRQGNLDYLAIGHWLVSNPLGPQTRQPGQLAVTASHLPAS
jgi:carbamoyltransferase